MRESITKICAPLLYSPATLVPGEGNGFEIEVDEETLEGTFSFTDPNYDFLGNSLSYSLNSTKNDKPDQGYENTIVGAGIGTTFEQYKDVYLSTAVNLNYDDLEVDSTASDSLKKQAGTFTDLTFGYAITKDERNRKTNPVYIQRYKA